MIQSDEALTVTFSREIVHVGGDLHPVTGNCDLADNESRLRFVGVEGNCKCCWFVLSARGRASDLGGMILKNINFCCRKGVNCNELGQFVRWWRRLGKVNVVVKEKEM